MKLKKNGTKTGITQLLIKLQQKLFSPTVSPDLQASKNVVLT